MMVAGIILSLMLVFSLSLVLVRRWIEPACPACTAKAWDEAAALACRRCGWSNRPAPPHSAEAPIAA